MRILYSDESGTLHHGDCLEVMRTLPDNSMDSVVTDPPYGLGNTDPAHVAETITRWVNGERAYLPGGSGFMGKAWDAFVPPPAVWDECLRVLKPGGHLLSFAGTRTVDLMTLGIRLAGFEIRDSIAWLYGSGFPKSLDVSKAIDKRPGVQRHAEFGAALREAMNAKGITNTFDVAESVIGSRTGAVANWVKYQFPEAKWWPALRDLLNMDEDTWGPVIAEAERKVIAQRVTGIGTGGGSVPIMKDGDRDITAPETTEAQKWQGWGTALKPAHEPIIVGRKPLIGTVAANVLAHGTGALNIDACRVGNSVRVNGPGSTNARVAMGDGWRDDAESHTVSGRWPANVVLDGSQADALDEQSGISTSSSRTGYCTGKDAGTFGVFAGQTDVQMGHDDHGGASRFFPVMGRDGEASANRRYTDVGGTDFAATPGARLEPVAKSQLFPTFRYQAKAPKRERPRVKADHGGDDATSIGSGLKVRQCNTCGSRGKPAGGEHSEKPWPTCGHGDWSMVEQKQPSGDYVAHPTVKPLALMRWLVLLVTPPGGTVLDPFAGSGTTSEACALEQFRCISIEREASYLPLIMARLNKPMPRIADAVEVRGGRLMSNDEGWLIDDTGQELGWCNACGEEAAADAECCEDGEIVPYDDEPTGKS